MDKFTKKQADEIIKAYDLNFTEAGGIKAVISFAYTVHIPNAVNKAVAIGNPETREQALLDYVVDERKELYYWTYEIEHPYEIGSGVTSKLSFNQPTIGGRVFLDFDHPTPLSEETIQRFYGDAVDLSVFTKEEVK